MWHVCQHRFVSQLVLVKKRLLTTSLCSCHWHCHTGHLTSSALYTSLCRWILRVILNNLSKSVMIHSCNTLLGWIWIKKNFWQAQSLSVAVTIDLNILKLSFNGELRGEVSTRIRATWTKWRSTTGVLCYRYINEHLKSQIHRSVLRLVVFYGSECESTIIINCNGDKDVALDQRQWSYDHIQRGSMIDMGSTHVFLDCRITR